MRGQERIYRMLLVAHPRRHRREYGEAMVQLMRDRVRDEGGGLRTVAVWGSLLVDLARSAAVERMAVVRAEIRTGWWRAAAVLVAVVLAAAGGSTLLEPATGPWYQYTLGRAALVLAPIAIATGLVLRPRRRWQGSALVGIGVLPGALAVVLFWYPPALLFGTFSLAVACAAADDVDDARRTAVAAPGLQAGASSSTAWPTPADPPEKRPT